MVYLADVIHAVRLEVTVETHVETETCGAACALKRGRCKYCAFTARASLSSSVRIASMVSTQRGQPCLQAWASQVLFTQRGHLCGVSAGIASTGNKYPQHGRKLTSASSVSPSPPSCKVDFGALLQQHMLLKHVKRYVSTLQTGGEAGLQ